MKEFINSLFNSSVINEVKLAVEQEFLLAKDKIVTREQLANRLKLLENISKLSDHDKGLLEKSSPEEYKEYREKEVANNYVLTLISTIVNLNLIKGFKWQAGAKPGIISVEDPPNKNLTKRDISEDFTCKVLNYLVHNCQKGKAISKAKIIAGLQVADPIQSLQDLNYLSVNKLLPGWKCKQGKNGGITRDE